MKKAEGTASTAEQNASYLVALERELGGYKARLAAIDGGHEDKLSPERLAGRVKEVEAEIGRVKGSAKKAGDK